MTDPNQKVDIDLAEVRAHRDHVQGVAGGIATAHQAAQLEVGHDAFGAFGYFLADECRAAAAEGVSMLGAAHQAADELCHNLGLWATDVEATESEIATLFSTAPEMRDV